MNHRVPDFELEEDYAIPASSSRPAARKSNLPDDEIMELLWQNGQVVMQSQKKSVSPDHTTAQPQNQSHLFIIQEDEMVSLPQYPLGDEDPFGSELLYTGSSNVQSNNPPPRTTELQNFLHFSKLNDSNSRPPPKSLVRKTTVTPFRVMNSRLDNSNASLDISMSGGGVAAIATAAKDATTTTTTCEMSLTSSPGRSSGSLSAEQMSSMKPPRTVEDRKRKGREVGDDSECQSEDVDFESAKAKKETRGSSLAKRSRAAEVHNLSERRRRDRINEKMKALQELIPRCNKSDKASMLDEAIGYLKSLQLQLQMMSMGCGMVPMMFPGVQQYMPMGMGMGLGMEMGMNRPMMPFANVLAGSTMPGAAAGTHMGPRFPIPPFQMQTMLPNDPNRVQATNQSEHLSNSLATQNQNQSPVQHFADPYQQYLTPQQMQMQMQMQLQQNQAMGQPSCSKGSYSMGPENQENHQ